MIAPKPGETLLDVGCGTGDDARQLAALVGPNGRVIGVDASRTMVEEGKKRAQGTNLPLDYRVADIMHLDFPDDSFDGTRAERILEHLPDPAGALRELVRVTRVGGRVVVSEPDWGSVIVDAEDKELTRKLLNYNCDRIIRSGWIGRQLPGLFKRMGLDRITVKPMAVGVSNFAIADQVLALSETVEKASADGVISKLEGDAWLSDLQQRGVDSTFYATITAVIVRGEKT